MALRIQEYFAPQGGVKDKVLALWGLAFKANTDDMREAASVSIVNHLTARGMRVRAFDPVAGDNARRVFRHNGLVEILDGQYEVCEGAHALLVTTEWNQFRNPDFERVKSLLVSPLLFDGRNLYSPSAAARRGFAYFCVGRGAV
jgi:UDPglucose 6-dehydrogenase